MAYQALGTKEYLDMALENARFIDQVQQRKDGGLNHNYKDGTSSINGYLEDYAAVVQAFIDLHQVTLDPYWLERADSLTKYTFEKFFNTENGLFFFTSVDDRKLVNRPLEYRDNVIPASNSVMANNLFLLAHYQNNPEYERTARKMLNNVMPELERNPGSFSNWLWLLRNLKEDFYEVVVVGAEAEMQIARLQKEYTPNVLYSGSPEAASRFLLKDRFVKGKTLTYLCVDNSCQLPRENILETLEILKNGRN